MSRRWLPIPHRLEGFVGGCLPACCQMALEFMGITRTQRKIAALIGHIEGAGTPMPNVVRLSNLGASVQYIPEAGLNDLQQGIQKGIAIIVSVRTGELPYWEEDVPHAVVVVGIDTATGVVYVNDPAFERAPIAVLMGDFMLAWDALGNRCVMIGQV